MKLLNGDCLEQLKLLPDNSVDALVTDPPYGLSESPDISDVMLAWCAGNPYVHKKKGFMGKEWDAFVPGPEYWREVYRVMKPGGHGLVFAGTRTADIMNIALRFAGFEIRDCVYWIHGQGFPKSLSVDTAIDKAAGAEREVIGPKISPDGVDYSKRRPSKNEKQWDVYSATKYDNNITAPATDAAKKWQGWGTALKPAVEPIALIRKPISEKTVAANVLKWGTGALNIDASRIEAAKDYGRSAARSDGTIHKGQDTFKHGRKDTGPDYASPLGRFPSHLILDEESARLLDAQSGHLKPAGSAAKRKNANGLFGMGHDGGKNVRHAGEGGASRFFYVAKTSKRERNAGLDRSELVWNQGVWENAVLLSSMESASQLAKGISDTLMQYLENKSWSTDLYGHSISEQYPQGFKSIIETVLKLITELRTSNSSLHSNTKESILAALKTIEASGLSLADAVAFSKRLDLVTISDATASLLNVSNALLCELEKIRRFVVSGNFHSTVKPQKLMRYLCRLITPPKGIIIDPFAGSFSTGVAAISEGFDFIGIEREVEYFEIGKKRIEHAENINSGLFKDVPIE